MSIETPSESYIITSNSNIVIIPYASDHGYIVILYYKNYIKKYYKNYIKKKLYSNIVLQELHKKLCSSFVSIETPSESYINTSTSIGTLEFLVKEILILRPLNEILILRPFNLSAAFPRSTFT